MEPSPCQPQPCSHVLIIYTIGWTDTLGHRVLHYFVISNRPKMFVETRQLVERLLPFVDGITVLVPDARRGCYEGDSDSPPVDVISEDDILSQRERLRLLKLDHQSRNYLLRRVAIDRLSLPEEFIMADDDARPLRRLELDFFRSSDRYIGYWFYRLTHWPSAVSDFDLGQVNTCKLLARLGADTLSYAAHMPQIINRDLYREIAGLVGNEGEFGPLCEWSTYFNLGRQLRPGLFHPPQPYRTLVWPEHPRVWPMDIQPPDYAFENLNPVLYRGNGLFADLATAADPEAAGLAKIKRWTRFCDGYLRGQNRFREDAALDGVIRTIVYRLRRRWQKTVSRRD